MRILAQQMDRRRFLQSSLAAGVVWTVGAVPGELSLPAGEVEALFEVDELQAAAATFPLSVAAGDPQVNGITLWTRLAPQTASVKVALQVAADRSFKRPLVKGLLATDADRDWIVKTQLRNNALKPFQTYYYRFIHNKVASPTGRFKTLPAADAALDRLRFAYISCQDYTNGYYTALQHLANEEIDFVVHLGDYIYETVSDPSFQGGQVRPIRLPNGGARAETLADYRFLYQTYKSDPDLQRVHERFAFISIWDDHEFANDSYREYDTDSADEAANYDPARRQAANQAWAEYTPAGVSFDATQEPLASLQIYRSFRFGTLMDLILTDERLYRSAPPCGLDTTDRYLVNPTTCPEIDDPSRTMLGGPQRDWFLDRMQAPGAAWKVWGNEVMVMALRLLSTYTEALFPPGAVPSGDLLLTIDGWDGYAAERAAILRRLREIPNVVTITGDIHTFIAGYQKENFDDPLAPPVAPCFVVGSVTSSNLNELATFGLGGAPVPAAGDLTLAARLSNPHFVYFNSATHGYALMEVTPQALTCTMKAVDTIRQPRATLSTLKVFRVASGSPLIQEITPLGG